MSVALRPERLDILSICTGGGGLDLGVELAIPGARSIVLVEREAFAAAQLVSAMEAGLLHQAPVWSDAGTFDGNRWRGCVDGLIGGIPCQGHSLAGRKRGSLDERDLWSRARRIIVQSRAWFVLIENVGGMLSPGDDDIAGAERVWRDLRKLGFSVEGGLFTAAEVGASHERERIFILGVADAFREGLQGRERAGSSIERDGQAPSRPVAELRGASLVDATGDGWREGQPEPKLRSGRHAAASANDTMGNAIRSRHDWRQDEPVGREVGRAPSEGTSLPTGGSMDDASIARGGAIPVQPRRQEQAGPDTDRPGLFPPGPGDIDAWRAVLARAPELEPAVRRVADGLASRLDIARVDRLRMLGNGVVPLQAAYAIRTLATRLAGRGSAGATRLVLMMEGI